ncbi:MAG: hypothetical protein WA005_09895 [Candidatus Binataceae bacterium]
MTKQRIATAVLHAGFALGVCIVALPISACAQSQLSAQERAQLIQKLETAKGQDEAIAADKTADPAQAEDALVQAYKADRRARDLEHGFEVSEAKIEHSLWVPPKALSTEQKAELIEKLEQTKGLDERNEEYSAEENSQVSEDGYMEHEGRVDRVLKDLEIGEDVPWSRIQRALEVPENL